MSSKIKLANGDEVTLYDLQYHPLLLPSGTQITIPKEETWTVLSVAVMPGAHYAPPDSGLRDVELWGFIQLRLGHQKKAFYRASALTLMDRYWGRYTLNPEWPELKAKIEHLHHAAATAPYTKEMMTLVDEAQRCLSKYIHTVEPKMEQPITVKEGSMLCIEHVDYKEKGVEVFSQNGETVVGALRDPLYVELQIAYKRPVY